MLYQSNPQKDEYEKELDLIEKELRRKEYICKFIKDYGKCIACKKDMEHNWLYFEYNIFCSLDCKRKPIADKCIVCKKDVPRNYFWKYPGYCNINCACSHTLIKYTDLSKDVIQMILEIIL